MIGRRFPAVVKAAEFATMEDKRSYCKASMANLHRGFFGVVLVVGMMALAQGAPILGPDLSSCDPVIRPGGGSSEDMVECCLLDRPTKDFELPTNLPMRVRRPVHSLDDEFIRRWEHGMALMRALPHDDPRSWFQQYKLHCAYTSNVYKQLGEFPTDEYISVHFNYLFLPFHRWFTYFQERIIAKLLGDDSFAIPYWAWDLQLRSPIPTNIVPSVFANESSPLYDPNRSMIHAPPNRVDLLIQLVPHNMEFDKLVESNYYQMWRVMKGESALSEVFYGSKLGLGDRNVMAGGPFEMGPHTGVHVWVGDERWPAGEDMAQPYVSARDPLFSSHHSQVDRLWQTWKNFGHEDLTDPDWYNSQFLFYDENGDRVRVNVTGCLDLEKMRISYEPVVVDWPERREPPVMSIRARGDVKYAPANAWGKALRHIADSVYFSRFGALIWRTSMSTGRLHSIGDGGSGIVTARIPRTPLSLAEADIRRNGGDNVGSAKEYDEVLIVKGEVTKPFHMKMLFNIFVELPEADSSTPLDCLESTGQIYIEAGRSVREGAIVTRKFHYKTGIASTLEYLGAARQKSVAVSFVPAWSAQYDPDISVQFTEIRTEQRIVR